MVLEGRVAQADRVRGGGGGVSGESEGESNGHRKVMFIAIYRYHLSGPYYTFYLKLKSLRSLRPLSGQAGA